MTDYNRKLHQLPTLSGARGSVELSGNDIIHMSVVGTPNTLAADAYSEFSDDGYLSVGVNVDEFTSIISDRLSFITAPNDPDLYNDDPDGLDLGDWRIFESANEYTKIKIHTSTGAIVERYVPVYNVIGTPSTYAVSYLANGATSGTVPSAQVKTYGVPLQLAYNVSGDPLAQDGLVFYGWNTASNGTGTQYDEGDTYYINANLSLYARWVGGVYYISYNANGGSGAVPTTQEKISGVDIALDFNLLPTRTGYTLCGEWNTQADGLGTGYEDTDLYTIDSSMILYAQWLINQYDVEYNLNGGTGTVPASGTYDYNDSIVAASLGDITYTGYALQEWNTNIGGTGDSVALGGAFTIPANNTTLYAKWALLTYTITYDGNGQTGGTAPINQTKTYGTDEYISANTGSLVKTGFEFDGWNTAADGLGTDYAPAETYSTEADLDLFAKWAASEYAITYDANNADSGTAPSGETKYYNVPIAIQTNYGSLAKEGFTLSGWNTAADGSGIDYAESESYTTNADLDLYAKWLGSWQLTLEIPAPSTIYSFQIEEATDLYLYVDWGDGAVSAYNDSNIDIDTTAISHLYNTSGTYYVTLSGGSPDMKLRLGNILGGGMLDYPPTPEMVVDTSVIQGIQCTTFDSLFENTSITDIPSGMFDAYTTKTSFNYTFNACGSLSGIPSSLFDTNTAATEFNYTFANTALASIHEDLFANNVSATSFVGTFAGYTGTTIPENLFASNTLVQSFNNVFESSNITDIPSGLVVNNVNALSLSYSFQNCYNLSGLAANIFEFNTDVTGYTKTFYNTPELIMVADLFGTDVSAHFNNGRTVDFTSFDAFAPSLSGLPVSGTAPELWNVTGSTFISTNAFTGNDEDSLLNWAEITAAWGGPA